MNTFDQTIERLALYFEQVEGTLVLIGVCDDTVLREHAVQTLRQRLSSDIALGEFRYDPEHLSLLEGAAVVTGSKHRRPAVSVTGLETLPRDKRTEAIKLLNLQRNRLGQTNIAVLLWVNRATLSEISTEAADFYSWRSATLFIEPPPEWDVLASLRRSYLEALVAHNAFVNLQGLAPMRGGQIVQMRMEDIFIPLQAEQEVPSVEALRSAFYDGENNTDDLRALIEDVPDVGEFKGVAPRRLGHRLESDGRLRRVDMPELLHERRAVVLGDPGAGKTTLLRYIAHTLAQAQLTAVPSDIIQHLPDLADCLPVYIRLGEYAQHLQNHPATTLEAFAPAGCQVRQLPLTDELLKDAMMRGRALFLLDGLDEIIDPGQRREVAQLLVHCARLHPQCRVLVTSRLVGYREAQLGEEFAQYTIRPFEDGEIRRFVQQGYAALGIPASAEELIKAIQDNPAIRRLASNPLLLTIIALMHWRGTRLPHHRVTLYRLAAETLVDQWMSQRRVSPEGWNAQEALRLFLPTIAWHMHHTTASGLIGQGELDALLVKALRRDDPRVSEPDAHARVLQFLRNVSEFSGIFLERSLDQHDHGLYGFLHLTFEEYFVALCLADKWQREGDSVLKSLLHDPRWTEIILLTAGHFGEFSQYQATRFAQTLLEARSEYEDLLHRDLLLAAQCLADDVRVDAEIRRTILTQLLKVYFASMSLPTLQAYVRQVFSRLGGTIVGAELSTGLMTRLTNRSRVVRTKAALALGDLGAAAATPEVLHTLLQALTDSDESVRRAAAWALGGLGAAAATPEVLHALLQALAAPEVYMREAAAGALGGLGAAAATPEVLHALLQALAAPEVYVREAATRALGGLGAAAATPEVLHAILQALAAPYKNVRWTAARALGALGATAATPDVLQALCQALSDPAAAVRWAAAGALGALGATAATPDVLHTLCRALSDPVGLVRLATVNAVGKLSSHIRPPDRVAVVQYLVPLARSHNMEQRDVGYIGLRNLLAAAPA